MIRPEIDHDNKRSPDHVTRLLVVVMTASPSIYGPDQTGIWYDKYAHVVSKTTMVQTRSGATQNPWLLHLQGCAKVYKKEQAEKAKAEAAPKRRLRQKTSPEEAQKSHAAKEEVAAPKPRRRLVKKTSPEEALAAAAAPPAAPLVAVIRRRIMKKMAVAAAAHVPAPNPAPAPAPKPVRRRLTQKTAPEPKPEPRRRLNKKTPTIHSRWQEPP